MNDSPSDLSVSILSDALQGRRIDVVVSGSIAAVESVRFIRALRRLGAEVTPWLTQGGSQFITPMALEWAANHPCVTAFSGTATHICTSDAVIVAPASSSFIGRIAAGQTETPASALVASALGQEKSVFILPAMHDSLANAPSYRSHLETIQLWNGVSVLSSRLEEGKRKFPEPATLADQVAHKFNQTTKSSHKVLITMGTTRGYIDDVRYLSNYSSGKLGSTIAEELYRQGFRTAVVSGPAEFQPKVADELIPVFTTSEMLQACQKEASNSQAVIFCASVLDYEPATKSSGKIRSGSKDLEIKLVPTTKIIEQVKISGPTRIGFKLETDLTETKAKKIAADYCQRYHLSALIANQLSSVSSKTHSAWAIKDDGISQHLNSKQDIARYINNLIKST